MPIRYLEAVFKPKSLALIGASDKPGSIGAILAENLLAAGFKGEVIPVNPKYGEIRGLGAYPDVASLPQTVDLGVICTPPDTVPGIVEALATLGVRGAVVISAGFGESHEAHGVELQKALVTAAKSGQVRIVGPNCLGILLHHLRQGTECSAVVAGHFGVARGDGKAACRAVHGEAERAHRLGHEGRPLGRAMRLHGAHAQTALSCLASGLVLTLGELPGDGLERHQVVAHVREHVSLHRWRKLDLLADIFGPYGKGCDTDKQGDEQPQKLAPG